MTETASQLPAVRNRVRDARHALAAAALSGDEHAQRKAAAAMLAAILAARKFYLRPSARVQREWRRWHRSSTAILHAGILYAGLLRRARQLADQSDNAQGGDENDH
jgi:hypothetical protein